MEKIDAYGLLRKIKEEKPLVHHITNWVTIYDCANIVRTFGGLPVMAHAREEVEEMVGISQALVLNIGTLTPELVDTMILAGKTANEKGIPVVLDAVGVGATKLRTESALKILKSVHVDVVKGNESEIGTLAGAEAETKGVESMGVKGDILKIAQNLAEENNQTVVVTGKTDKIVSKGKNYLVENGHSMMGAIVGTGCMSASVIGAFCAVEKDYALAACAALACFGISGELAAEKSNGPGSFKEQLYDEAFNLGEDTVLKRIRISLQ